MQHPKSPETQTYTFSKGKSRLAILSSLPPEQRLSYFKDQLLTRLAIGVTILLTIIFLIIHIASPAPQYSLRIASVNPLLNQSQADTLAQHTTSTLQLTGSNQPVNVDTGFGTDGSELNKLQVMLSNGDIDIIIARRQQFEQLATYGYLININTLFKRNTRSKLPQPLQIRGFDDTDHNDAYYDGTGKGDLEPCGFATDLSPLWNQWHMPQAYIGIAQDSKHVNQAKAYIIKLFENL